jgi:phage baseplate assembly protein W
VPETPDHRDFLGVGWSFPVALDPMSGDIALARYDRDVKQAIRIILETAPGERVMRPSFGCGIHDLVFEQFNETTRFAIEAAASEALITYEPRIELSAVTVDARDAMVGCLFVSIDYRLRRTNQEDNLVYPFYFREGGER